MAVTPAQKNRTYSITASAPAESPNASHGGTSPLLCKPVPPAFFRFSWSFNRFAGGSGLVVMDQDTLANLMNKNVSTHGCPYARGASADTADAAFVYIVASQLPVDPPFTKPSFGFLQENTELFLLQISDAPGVIDFAASRSRGNTGASPDGSR